jgi:hypothetical protein
MLRVPFFRSRDFTRDYLREKLGQLSSRDRKQLLRSLPPADRREILQAASVAERLAGLPPEERSTGLSPQQIRRYLDQLGTGQPSRPRKPRRKK